MKIGYHASHEQFPPRDLLAHVKAAEKGGFQAASCSDHLFPWSARQGHSGFAWSWLGAALEATSLPFGVVNAPGYRYHPVIVAQAAATLEQMYPGRFWIAVGSGEALNEHVTGERWPLKRERNERLLECASIMRRLWAGETVTHRGHVEVHEARVYSRPDRPPRMVGAALSEATAEWMGGWADGLITVANGRLKEIIGAFRRGGGEGKPVVAQAKVSWAKNDAEAMRGAMEQWSTMVFTSAVASELTMPEHFEELAKGVTEDQMRQAVWVSSDPKEHVERIRAVRELGVSELYIHNVNLDQSGFIETYSRDVLPSVVG